MRSKTIASAKTPQGVAEPHVYKSFACGRVDPQVVVFGLNGDQDSAR
jgi:hypothetical protein